MCRFLLALVVVSGLLLIPNLGCAPESKQAPTPDAPMLSSPANDSTVSNLAVELKWKPSVGATSYRLQISTDSAFSKPVIDKTGITSTYHELTSGLSWETSYYWRVNASNASGTSSWSGSWKFATPVLKLGKIAFASNRDGAWDIYAMNTDDSNQTRLTNLSGEETLTPSCSPDGSKIAFDFYQNGNWEIYIMNADGSNQTRLTDNPAADLLPSWSPDGAKITFASDRDGNLEIYVMNADGSNQTRLTNNPTADLLPSWSPDSKKIAFSSDRDGNFEIYVMNADGSNQTRLTNNNANDAEPRWSPDGTKIAFSSDRDGNLEIYVMNADGSNQIRITNNSVDDVQPRWQ